MTDTATLEQYLAEAEEALHSVLIGQSVTVVGYDGQRTEWTPAKEDRLRRYIRSLKRQLKQDVGTASRRVVF